MPFPLLLNVALIRTFSLVKPFMDPEAFSNIILKPDCSHLSTYIARENLLRQWGGEIDFDLDEYIRWRAEEEGVTDLLTSEVRRFSATEAANSLTESSDFSSLSSFDMSHNDPPPTKMDRLWKRGSGVGFFSSFKWKQKLFCVGPGGLAVYFDSTEVSEGNKASRVVPLAGAYAEPIAEGMDAKSFGFQVIAPSRSFVFSCKSNTTIYYGFQFIKKVHVLMPINLTGASREELDQWLAALATEISVANQQFDLRQRK